MEEDTFVVPEGVPVPDDALADLSDAEQVALIKRTDNSFNPDEPEAT